MDNLKTGLEHIDVRHIEWDMSEEERIYVHRQLFGPTELDLKIEAMPIPKWPVLVWLAIKLIRLYRKFISHRLGNRCVYDPSCSHYSELVYRQTGFWRGTKLTIDRLRRCKPGNGGTDWPEFDRKH